MTLLSGRNLYKEYQTEQETVQVLRGLSISIDYGKSIAIIGRSGEGKSTLLHVLGTLEKPTRGHLVFQGKEVHDMEAAALRNRHIGFIFQSFHLLEEYTVLENILMPGRIARQNVSVKSPLYQRSLDLLEYVELAHRANFPIKRLSGGEKQRVAIARALLHDPDLILADEPSGNLDQGTSQVIFDLLLRGAQTGKKALIIVTHDTDLASRCDQKYLLKEGQLWTY